MAWLISLLLHNTGEAVGGLCCPVPGNVRTFLCALTHLSVKAEERPSLTAASPCSDLWREDGIFWLLVRTVVPVHYYILGLPLYSLDSKENTPFASPNPLFLGLALQIQLWVTISGTTK